MGWSFFNADEGDERKYGIPFGIYIKTKEAIPIYTTFLIAHELIHVAVGFKGSDRIARGLEEGLAELLGCIYLFSRLKGREITANLLTYNRLFFPPNQKWDVYLDNLRQAILLYHSFGLTGIKELICGGRDMIKRVESLILRRDFGDISLSKGEWDNDVNYLVSYILSFPRNYVVSPLAKYISNFVERNITVGDIISNNRIDPIQGEEALKELEMKLFLLIIKDGYIVNSDMDTISDRRVLRYLIT